MLDSKSIATYLIYRKLVSNHTLTKWLPLLELTEREYDIGIFPGIRFIEKVRELHELGTISTAIASHLLQISIWKHEAEALMQLLRKNNIVVVGSDEKGFPEGVKHIPDAPFLLFIRGGSVDEHMGDYITIVGTRSPTEWGKTMATQLTREAVIVGLTTVTGFAKGIDTIVHKNTVERGGKTIAILPELVVVSPCKRNCIEISEYLSGDRELCTWQYVARNRIAASISGSTVVVEAPVRSGTLITAQLAEDYDREIFVALPQPGVEESYGGIAFAQSRQLPKYIQSLYDVFWQQGNLRRIRAYYNALAVESNYAITVSEKENRHLADVDIKRLIFTNVGKNLGKLDKTVVELSRLGMIRERKGKIVLNFSWVVRNG